jgi:ABC-type multidrug transport system fused ATPase/permease subunit
MSASNAQQLSKHEPIYGRNFLNSRSRKFLSYYKPYLGLFFADMVCAFIVSAITLVLPLCARYITQNLLGGSSPMRSAKSTHYHF